MRIFNNTDVPLDVRDRVILPGMSIEYGHITDQTLTPDERKAVKLGLIGASGPSVKLRDRLRLPSGAKVSVIQLHRLLTLI